MNLLSQINPSLAYVYCSTSLSNHGLIRLKRFFSRKLVTICVISYIFNLYLILNEYVQTFNRTSLVESIYRRKAKGGDELLRFRYFYGSPNAQF
jgi:hypothetical protein